MRKFFNEMNYIFSKHGIFAMEGLSFTPKVDDQLKYISAKERQLNKVLHFEALSCGRPTLHALFSVEPVTTDELQRSLLRWLNTIDGTEIWTTVHLENHDSRTSGDPKAFAGFKDGLRLPARDNARVPMQWDS